MQGEGSQRRKSASFYFTSYTALRFVQSALLGLRFTVLCCLFMFHCQDYDINIKYYNYHCQPEVKVKEIIMGHYLLTYSNWLVRL